MMGHNFPTSPAEVSSFSSGKFWRPFLFVFFFSCLPINASFGDQCQWLNRKQAEIALKYLNQSEDILKYCAPCGDNRPVRHLIKSSEISEVSGGFEIKLYGPEGPITPVDLAYIFISIGQKSEKGKKDYFNLAYLAGCPAVETPLTITIRESGPLAGPHSYLELP